MVHGVLTFISNRTTPIVGGHSVVCISRVGVYGGIIRCGIIECSIIDSGVRVNGVIAGISMSGVSTCVGCIRSSRVGASSYII